MFTKGTKYILQGGFNPLKDVGKYPPPKKSMFYIEDNPELRFLKKKKKNDAQIELEERLAAQQQEEAEGQDGNLSSPVKKDANETNEDGVKTTVKSCGRIKFQGIVVPPEAPKDLICEECERKFAEYYCGACQEVYCFICADMCHPKISANDLMHAHERDGRIRAVQVGDSSRVKQLVTDEAFYLPENMFFFEEYNQVRDLTKPNSLSTGVKDAKLEEILAPKVEPVKHNPIYSVNQYVLFTDPAAEAPAYGKVISQWDRVHGLSAPAIIRGGEAANYYIVQKMGLLVDTDDLESLLPKQAKTAEERAMSKTSMYDANKRLAKEIDDAPLRIELEIAKKVTKKLKELESIVALGPKYHLRSVDITNGKTGTKTEEGPDEQDPDVLAFQSQFDQEAMQTNGIAMGNIKMRSRGGGGGGAGRPEIPVPTAPVVGPLSGKGMMNMDNDLGSQPSRKSSMSGSVYNIHGTDEEEGTVVSEAPSIHTINPRDVIDKIEYRNVDPSVYKPLDLSLYADVDIEDQSVLSHFNANQRPLPASYRSYQHVVKDQVTKTTSNRLLDSLKEVLENPDAIQTAKNYEIINPEVTKEMLNIIIFPETALECMKEKIAFYKARKEMMLRRAMRENDYIWLRVQVKWKFDVWKASLRELQIKKRHFYARKIQSYVRRWLCRNQLDELRQYWDNIAEQKRQKVHKMFRFTSSDDRYAVSFDNKLFFPTYADMNRYAYFLRVQCGKIVRNFNIKRLAILKQSIHVWKEAIYEFLESTLQNDHIQTNLVDFDQEELSTALRKVEREDLIFVQKQRIIEQHDKLLAFLSPLYYNTAYFQTMEGVGGAAGTGGIGGDIGGGIGSDIGMPYYGIANPEPDDGNASIASNSLNSVASYRYYYEGYYDEFGYENVTSIPLRIQSTYSEEEKKKLQGDQQRGKGKEGGSPESKQVEKRNIPAHDPNKHIPNLPPLFKLSRPKAFKDRLYHDLQQQLHLLPPKLRASYKQILNEDDTAASTASTTDGTTKSTSVSVAATSSPAHSTAATAAASAKNNAAPIAAIRPKSAAKNSSYTSLMAGPTTQSYWMIPHLLMVGNAPLGPAQNFEFSLYDTIYNTGLYLIPENDEKPKPKKILPRNYDEIIYKKRRAKKSILSGMAALLLLGINTFISLMSEEEENAMLYFHDLTVSKKDHEEDLVDENTPNPPLPTSPEAKHYKVKTMKERLEQEMENVKATAIRMIEDYTEAIRKQEFNLTKIPIFGKTDPRYAASYREILRCEARISIARTNIQKIKQQIKRVPKRIVFIRLPVSEYSTPWNKDMILPSIWMLEQLFMQRYDQLISNVYPEESILWIKQEEERIKREAEERERKKAEEEEERRLAKLEAERNGSKFVAPPKAYRDSLNAEYESKNLDKHQNLYYLYGGGPHGLHEDGVSKDGRCGLLAAILLARLYRLNPLEAIYRWQRAHDSMTIYSENPNQRRNAAKANKHYDTYKTPVPPLPWMRNLLIDMVHLSHRPLEPVTYRTQYTPDDFAVAQEDKYYNAEDGKLKINNLRYDNTSVYQETTLDNFNKGVKVRGGDDEASKPKKEKVSRSILEMLNPVEEEAPKGPTEEDRVQFILFEKEYEEDYVHEKHRTKQSLYFKHSL